MADQKITALDAKVTPADADQVVIVDEAAAPDHTKKVTWANVKATLKTYFDTLYALLAHKDRHDPEDGADPLDCAAAAEIAGVQAAAEGSAHSFARSDHDHQIQHGIIDNHLVTIDDADAASGDYCKLTADGIEGREASEVVSDILSSFADQITGAHLSQTFGASAGRLLNYVTTPVTGKILRELAFTSGSPFSGVIDDNAGAHGGQGLDATHVPYDGDLKEDMFTGLDAYDGTNYWGQIILHNTTRSNSRKIVSVDRTNDVIVTSSSTDDWADDDVITVQSQTNVQAGYFDVDVSDKVAATVAAAMLFVTFDDAEGNIDANRYVMFHPFESHDEGKRQWLTASAASMKNTLSFPLAIIGQKLTMMYGSGCNGCNIVVSVVATMEYADT